MEEVKPAKKQQPPRPTHIELEHRVSVILDLMLRGANRRTIGQFAAKQWNVSIRQADRYIRMATNAAIEEQHEVREKSFALAMSRMKKMLAKNADGDQRVALEICKEIHKLQGIYPAEKQEVKMTGSLVSTLTDEELDKAIAAAEGVGRKDGAPTV